MDKIKIGDVAIVEGWRDNPYVGPTISGERRAQLLRDYRDAKNTAGFTFWYAPAAGGARKITRPGEIDWTGLRSAPSAPLYAEVITRLTSGDVRVLVEETHCIVLEFPQPLRQFTVSDVGRLCSALKNAQTFVRTVENRRPIDIAGQGILCEPFDNSGSFTCAAGEKGGRREAVHQWTHPTSGLTGTFCPLHSPFDYPSEAR